MFYAILREPTAEKGIMAKILCQELHVPHISTGEILRESSKTDPAMQNRLNKGILISDEILTKLLYSRIAENDCLNGFVIDGYPRSLNQVHLLNNILEKFGKKLSAAIELKIPNEIIIKRILEKQICIKCSNIYTLTIPSQIEDICDNCHDKFKRHSYNTKETLKTRINLYRLQLQQILEYYKSQDKLITINEAYNPYEILRVIDYN